jgi:hypothetical protein
MKALQIATIFALLVFGAISNNIKPTEMLAQRIPSVGLKMLGIGCSNCNKPIKNDQSLHRPKPNQPSLPFNRYEKDPSVKNWSPGKKANLKEFIRNTMRVPGVKKDFQKTGGYRGNFPELTWTKEMTLPHNNSQHHFLSSSRNSTIGQGSEDDFPVSHNAHSRTRSQDFKPSGQEPFLRRKNSMPVIKKYLGQEKLKR